METSYSPNRCEGFNIYFDKGIEFKKKLFKWLVVVRTGEFNVLESLVYVVIGLLAPTQGLKQIIFYSLTQFGLICYTVFKVYDTFHFF